MNWLPKVFLAWIFLSTLSCEIEERACTDVADCFDGELCQSGMCTSPQNLLTPKGGDDNNISTQTCGPLDCKTCENGEIDSGEECDTLIDLTETCVSRGYSSGTLVCSKCKVDESACVALETCQGNGLDDGEICDGDVFRDDKTCKSEGFDGGDLKCSVGCSLKTDDCFKCGDGQINGDEVCDDSDFGGKTCGTESGLVGPLSCSSDCKTINTESCAEGVLQVAAGRKHACLLTTTGEIKCWGSNGNDELLHPLTGTYSKIGSGDSFSCALETNGDVRCWGRYYDDVPEGKIFDDIAVGNRHVCAREKATKKLVCWGTIDFQKTRAPDIAFTNFSCGASHSCGLKEDKTLECWGRDTETNGKPDDGVFTSITSGAAFSCGLLSSGVPVCFGSGMGITDRIPGNYVQLTGGGTHVCGLLSDGNVNCWGAYQADMGHLVPPKDIKFTQISAGLFFTCGITRPGDVLCWGENDTDQLTPPSL